jgi:SAM-dependent methyltransferase
MSAIRHLPKSEYSTILDIGCAEGVETTIAQHILRDAGIQGTVYAFDPQASLVRRAKEEHATTDIHFLTGSYRDMIEREGLSQKVDLVMSQFALQDTPDAAAFVEQIADTLRPGGTAIITLVHPEFGEAMRRKGACTVKENLVGPWQFAAEYPIVEPGNKTFMVPYFQRSVEEYHQLFDKKFADIHCAEFRPNPAAVAICERERRSPLYDHEGNVYYPEIVKQDSCLLIEAKR